MADYKSTNAIILNFQAPKGIDDLVDRFMRDGLTNIDHILHFENTLKQWTVDKKCKSGDLIFFMCAKTSADHMGHICIEVYKTKNKELIEFADEKKALYKIYAGKIVAIGRIDGDLIQSDISGYAKPAWRTNLYANIKNFQKLEYPVSIDEFRSFITVRRTGSITHLSFDQQKKLIELIRKHNNNLCHLINLNLDEFSDNSINK